MTGLDGLGAVILAAGLSSRMGGEQKLAKSLDGKPLLRHCLDTVSALGLADVVAVTGHAREDVEAVIAESGIRCVFNADYAQGMGKSLAAGIANLNPDVAGAFIVLGDMPFVAAEDYRLLAQSFTGHGGDMICRPVCGGRAGHPVLFPRSLFEQLRGLTGDSGGAALIASQTARLRWVDIASPRVLADFDTREDFCSRQAQ